MKLATFVHDGVERWGFAMTDPATDAEYLVDPARAELEISARSGPTTGYSASPPRFLGDDWPDTLAGFLALGDEGLAVLGRLASFLARFVAQSDATVLDRAAHLPAEVELLAPIPRPRLCWGLVANSPSFARNKAGLRHLNLFPLGHQRPQGSVIGADATVLMRNGHHEPIMSFNVELGVVIGTGGRFIAVEEAMRHVAGFTTITDVAGTYYYGIVPGNEGRGYELPERYGDWFYQATASWGGKIADTLCPMGPYLVTKDEVGDPYDLLVYTRQDGRVRNRAHTSATILGIERVISWYSSFATLYPGDVIHFGTMGVDGLSIPRDVLEAGTTIVESEIEDVGTIRNPVHVVPRGETVPFEHHPSYAVRRAAAEPPMRAEDWNVDRVRHVYTAFGNHDRAEQDDGLPRLEVPRFFTGPASSLGASGAAVELPPRAGDLVLGIELAIVIGALTSESRSADDRPVIAGLTPLVSVCDLSFQDAAIEPARPGERHIPAVYGRWADGFNVVLAHPVPSPDVWRGRRMTLTVGGEQVSASTADYVAGAAELIDAISAMTTLFPGDVITLGATTARIRVPAGSALEFRGGIEGLGEVHGRLVPSTSR